ncbi:MAG: hypothetical protein QOD33_93 [Pyrinomonadaceae bacterium]|jgi:hypothetical protein|nr:hypothetical protein [Pyrinomonadaceae bacterium]
MKKNSLAVVLLILGELAGGIQAQTTSAPQTQDPLPNSETRPRTIASPVVVKRPVAETENVPPASPLGTTVGTKPETRPLVAGPAATERHAEPLPAAALLMSPPQIQARIAEAERLLKSRPAQTALSSPAIDMVTLALLDRRTSRIHLATLYKESFLTKGSELLVPSSLGTPLTIRILRANGVNTAVAVFDNQGHSFVPLVVEFPIEKRGSFREMAYYTSAHPALLSPDLTRAGRSYVHRMLDLAVKRLREKGNFIAPQIVDVAERLCLVEHVDHDRFRNENRAALFDEIYSLFALNEPDTYRYSVSTAGAGGMVQMIPWAYNLVRQRHPGVGLTPDFVVGMRNHANALQAMLLYMQDTWNDLAANEDVQYALSARQASQIELLAAGYNSNAARLPLYLRRGGSAWRTLIPRETQMYLQIYKAVESLVPQTPHANPPVARARPRSARPNSFVS